MLLRRETMEGIHDGHFGEKKSVLRAKSAVYWPGWEDQVKNMVASCAVCQENRCGNPKQPLYPVRLPDYAFQMVSADIFHFESVNYLLLVDSYSKLPCVVPLKSMTSAVLIEEMSRFSATLDARKSWSQTMALNLQVPSSGSIARKSMLLR
jgi:hypothetical protein